VPLVNGTGVNQTVAVGGFICRPGCNFVYNVCYEAIKQSLEAVGYPQLLPQATSCSPPWFALYGVNLPGVDTFPTTTQYTVPVTADNYTSPTFNATLNCYSGNFNVTTNPPADLCPEGFYFKEGTCALLCPHPLLSASEFDSLSGVAGGFGWLSFLLLLVLLLSFLLEHKRRQFPHDLFIYFVISLILVSFSFVMASIIGFKDMDCENDKTPNDWGSPGCTIQGMLYVYFSLTSVFWWLVICFNYFLMVVMGYKTKPEMAWREWLNGWCGPGCTQWRSWFRWETMYVFYHLFAWGLPLVPLFISLAAHRLGYGGYDIWCTIHSGSQVTWKNDYTGEYSHSGGDPAQVWHIVLFDVPILVAVCLGCGFLVAVIVYGIKEHRGKIWAWDFVKEHWRLALFLGFYIYIYIFVFSFHIHQGIEAEKQYDQYDSYITCAFNSKLLSPTKISLRCSVNNEINFPLWVVMAINVASQGTIAFLILGTTRVLLQQIWWFITLPLVLFKYMDPVPLDLEKSSSSSMPGLPSSGTADTNPGFTSTDGGADEEYVDEYHD